jgi:hypothetical protein
MKKRALGKRGKEVIVKKKGDVWEVRKEGNERATAVVLTRKEAVKIGRRAARSERSELIVHDEK